MNTNLKSTIWTLVIIGIGTVGAKIFGVDWNATLTGDVVALAAVALKHFFHINITSDPAASSTANGQ